MKFITLLLFLFSSLSYAAQDALIMKDRAIIYADIHQKHPIGFVRQWQRIRVGTVARAGGTVMPIVISKNKIGYISVDDFSIGRDTYSIANINKQMDQSNDRPLKNNFEFGFDSFVGKSSVQDSTFGTNLINMTFVGVALSYNKYIDYRFDLKFGGSYITSSADDGVTLSHMPLKAGVVYKFPSFFEGKINAVGMLDFSPYSTLKTQYFDITGLAYGAHLGIEASYPITKRAWVSALAGYQYLQMAGFELPSGLGEFNPTILGTKIGFNLNIYL